MILPRSAETCGAGAKDQGRWHPNRDRRMTVRRMAFGTWCSSQTHWQISTDQAPAPFAPQTPISAPSAMLAIPDKSTGRLNPRWSEVAPKACPASNAGLPASKACVWVVPPLLASGPSCGSTLSRLPVLSTEMDAPVVLPIKLNPDFPLALLSNGSH